MRGADDPQLGRIAAVLLSRVHHDHLGDVHQAGANAGTCAKADFSVRAVPNSNTVNIVVTKKAKVLLGGEMPPFFARRIKAAGGDPGQVALVRFGASYQVGGVTVSSVPADMYCASPTARSLTCQVTPGSPPSRIWWCAAGC